MGSLNTLRAFRGLGTRFDQETLPSESERLLGENAELTIQLQNAQLRDELFGGGQLLQDLERQQRDLRLQGQIGPAGFFENPAFIEGVSDPSEVQRFLRLTLDAQGNVVPVGGAIPELEPQFRRREGLLPFTEEQEAIQGERGEFLGELEDVRRRRETLREEQRRLRPRREEPRVAARLREITADLEGLAEPPGALVGAAETARRLRERGLPLQQRERFDVTERVGAVAAKPTAAEQRAARQAGLTGLDEDFLAGVKADLSGQQEAGTSRLADLDAQIAAARSLQATGIRSGTRLRQVLEQQRGQREQAERGRVQDALKELDDLVKRDLKTAIDEIGGRDADPKKVAEFRRRAEEFRQKGRRSITSGRELGVPTDEREAPEAPPQVIGGVTLGPAIGAEVARPEVAERAAAVTADTPQLIRTALERRDQDFDTLLGKALTKVGRQKATRRERRRTGREFVQMTDRELIEQLRRAIEGFESAGKFELFATRIRNVEIKRMVSTALQGVAEDQREATRPQFTLFVLNELLRRVTERQRPRPRPRRQIPAGRP